MRVALWIIAHPFRYLFEPSGILSRNVLFEDPLSIPATPEEAAEHTIFSLVDGDRGGQWSQQHC